MKQSFYKKPLVLLCILSTSLLLSGCSVFGTQIFFGTGCSSDVAFKIGNLECPTKEVNVYATSFADYYGMIGDKNLWGSNANTESVEQSIKTSIQNIIVRVYALNVYATDNNITLSPEQNTQVLEAANEYYNGLTDAQKSDLNVSLEDINKMYTNYAISLVVFHQIISQIDDEISEDEARVMLGYVLELPESEDISNISSSLTSFERFPNIVQAYSIGETGMLDICRGDLPKDVENAAFHLENGEITESICCDGTRYFVACVEKYDQEKSEEHKRNIITQREQKLLSDIEKDQNESYYSQINEKYWDSLEIKGDDQNRSSLFFSVLEKHLTF